MTRAEMQPKRPRILRRLVWVWLLLLCSAAGGLVYMGLNLLKGREQHQQFFEPERLPQPWQGSGDLPTSPVAVSQMDFLAPVFARANDPNAPIERYRGINLGDVGLAVLAVGPLDTKSLPPAEEDEAGRQYLGVELAASSKRDEPVRIDEILIELVRTTVPETVYACEYVETDERFREIPTGGDTITFRAVFAVPRALKDLAVRVGVWTKEGTFERAVLPARAVRDQGLGVREKSAE